MYQVDQNGVEEEENRLLQQALEESMKCDEVFLDLNAMDESAIDKEQKAEVLELVSKLCLNIETMFDKHIFRAKLRQLKTVNTN